jgi:hypothetical protein
MRIEDAEGSAEEGIGGRSLTRITGGRETCQHITSAYHKSREGEARLTS